jgi:hypothetical protein
MIKKSPRGRRLTDALRRDIVALGPKATPSQVLELVYGDRPNRFARKVDGAKRARIAECRALGWGSKRTAREVGISRTQAQRLLRALPAPPAWVEEETIQACGERQARTTSVLVRDMLERDSEAHIMGSVTVLLLLQDRDPGAAADPLVRQGVMAALLALRQIAQMAPRARAEREQRGVAYGCATFSFKRLVERSSIDRRVKSFYIPPTETPAGWLCGSISPAGLRMVRPSETPAVLGPLPDLRGPGELIDWVRLHRLASEVMDT